MSQKKKTNPKKILLVSFFGVIGYISNVFQWLWIGIIFLPLLFENSTFKDLILPKRTTVEPVAQHVTNPELSFITIAVGVGVTVLMVILTVFILIRLPKSVATSTKKTTTAAARAVVPVIIHHQKISAKKERVLTARLVKYLKFVSCLLPLLFLPLTYLFETELPHTIILFVGVALSAGSLVWFTFEYLFAHIFHIAIEDVF